MEKRKGAGKGRSAASLGQEGLEVPSPPVAANAADDFSWALNCLQRAPPARSVRSDLCSAACACKRPSCKLPRFSQRSYFAYLVDSGDEDHTCAYPRLLTKEEQHQMFATHVDLSRIRHPCSVDGEDAGATAWGSARNLRPGGLGEPPADDATHNGETFRRG